MILNILLIIVVLFCGLAVLLLLAPVNAIVGFSFRDFQLAGSGELSFFHPLLFTARVDFASRRFFIRILGLRIGRKRKGVSEDLPPSDVDQSEETRLDGEGMSPGDTGRLTDDNSFGRSGEENAPPPSPSSGEDAVEPQPAAPETSPLSMDGASTTFPRADAPDTTRHSVSPPEPDAPQQSTDTANQSMKTEPASEELVAPKPEKKDNWLKRLQQSRYLFFLRRSAWRNKVLRWIIRVVRSLFRIVRFDRFRLAVRAGVEDPMVTGTIAGLHQAAVHALTMKKPYAISFEPVFMTNCFSCSGSLRVGTSLGRLLLPVVVAIATFPTIHTLWLVWCCYLIERQRKRSATV